MMRIGTRISADWIDRPDDLQFLKQIGVDYVDIVLDMVPGYKEAGGRANKSGLEELVAKLDEHGLKIERANTMGADYANAFLGQPGGDREIDNLMHNARICGELDIPVFGIQCFQAASRVDVRGRLHSWVTGRGGYQHARMAVRELAEMPLDRDAPSRDQIWDGTLSIYRNVMPVAEEVGINVAMHGNDPPVPQLGGVPQVLYNFEAFDRLFTEVPSPNNCMTFCVGTRYESGENIFEGLRRFGDRLVHVHFRNVRGTIPERGYYEEVMPDLGDLEMYEVARTLHEVGYEGVIDYDHIMRLATDGPAGREYISFCVGYMRGILQSLETATRS